MAGGGAAQQSNQADNSLGIIWVLVTIFVILGIIWYEGRDYIIDYYLKLKLFEIKIISYFSHNLDDVAATINMTHFGSWDLNAVLRVGSVVGGYLRLPLALFVAILAVLIYVSNPVRAYKRIYDMEALAKMEQENWPQISTVLGLNLGQTDINKGPWAMAMTPMQFCKKISFARRI